MRLSLCITTYNRPAYLKKVLDGVRAQRELPAEVIVCDDGSGEESWRLVRREAASFPVPLEHVWQPDEGWRVSRARNGAIARARGDYLVFIDGDCVPHRQFIAEHRMLAEPGCFVAGERAHVKEAVVSAFRPSGAVFLRLMASGAVHKRKRAWRNPFERPGRFHRDGVDTEWLFENTLGANLAFWRNDAGTVNGFDESCLAWGPEDADFALRLLNGGISGKKVRNLALTYHLDHPSALDTRSPWFERVRANRKQGTVRCEEGLDRHLGAGREAASVPDAGIGYR